MNAQSSGKIVPKVTITSRSITISEVFKMIRKQTGKVIWYRNEDVNESKKVNVNFKDASLEDVLKFLFQASDISWTYDDEAIILRKKKLSDNTSSSIVDTSLSPIQLITVTGKVTDEKGSPIIGATVVLKGNNQQGTTTNADGFFTLGAVKENASIVVSSVSFLTQEIPVRGRKSVGSVVMKEYVGVLDEVQIQAYGTTSRRIGTGNISTVKATDIAKSPVQNPLLALQGRTPGVFIEQSSGLPNSGVKIRIQGQNSLLNGNDPLFVIDGVPYSSQLLPSLGDILGRSGEGGTIGNPLSFINPADIESIDILKDGDATAIYGSRAANGAVLITTKKGIAGKTKVGLNLQQGFGEITRKMKLLNTQQYLEVRNEAFKNDNSVPSADPSDFFYYAPDLKIWDTARYTDWQKVLIGGTAKYTDLQGTISGGNQTTQFLVGIGYKRESTVFPGNTADQKGSLHINLNNTSANQKFKFNTSGSYLIDDNKLQSIDLTNQAIILSPNAPRLYDEDGNLNFELLPSGNSTFENPLRLLENKYKMKTKNLIFGSNLSYQIFEGLQIKSNFGYNDIQTNEVSLYPSSAVAPERRPIHTRLAQFRNSNINSWIIEPQLNFIRSISRGKIEILIGTTIQKNVSILQSVTGTGYNSDLVLEDINSAANINKGGSIASTYKYNALFGRFNYNWQNQFIVNITARRDGSSRFGSENRFNNFYSVAGAWIFSAADFIKENLKPLSFGKLRISYGTTGNDQISDYSFLSLYSPTSGVGRAYQGATGLTPNSLPNPYLQWEETRKIQFGIDIGFLNDRILLNTNYYRNRSSNQLLNYVLPYTAGFANIKSNFPALIQNSGWEFSLSIINIHSKFKWSTNINLTIPKNKLLQFPNLASSSYANDLIIGASINARRFYKFSGIDPATGIYQFADSSGKLVNDPGFGSENKIVIVDTDSKYYGGLQNSFSYGNLQLDVLFQFVKQIAANNDLGSFPGQRSNQPATVLNRWQKPGDNKEIQKYTTGINYDVIYPAFFAGTSDRLFSDASYIRLKNLSLSWQLPKHLKERIQLQSARLYIQGQNLFTITKFNGLDPENRSTHYLPPLRMLTMGIQVDL